MVVIIGKMDNSVENVRPIQLTTGSLIDAYQNESVLCIKPAYYLNIAFFVVMNG